MIEIKIATHIVRDYLALGRRVFLNSGITPIVGWTRDEALVVKNLRRTPSQTDLLSFIDDRDGVVCVGLTWGRGVDVINPTVPGPNDVTMATIRGWIAAGCP